MKQVILLLHTLLLISVTKAQETYPSKEKANTIFAVIEKVINKEKFEKTLVLVDMSYKSILATLGIGASLEVSDSIKEDTSALGSLKRMIVTRPFFGEELILKSFKEVNFNNRYTVISSNLFLDLSNAVSKKAGYIEIHTPIDGWELGGVLIGDSMWSGESYMQFELPMINIPVHVYYAQSDQKFLALYLFRFKIRFNNREFSTNFLDYLLIGSNNSSY